MRSEWGNIKECNKNPRAILNRYTRTWWPVNDKPLNTFGTLELLFPISKREFVLVLFLSRWTDGSPPGHVMILIKIFN